MIVSFCAWWFPRHVREKRQAFDSGGIAAAEEESQPALESGSRETARKCGNNSGVAAISTTNDSKKPNLAPLISPYWLQPQDITLEEEKVAR